MAVSWFARLKSGPFQKTSGASLLSFDVNVRVQLCQPASWWSPLRPGFVPIEKWDKGALEPPSWSAGRGRRGPRALSVGWP